MEKFWAALLIFGITAVLGFGFYQNVYVPQNQNQQMLAESSMTTTNSVRASMDSDTALVSADSVISTVALYCKPTNTTYTVIVNNGSSTYTYTTSSAGITSAVSDTSFMYSKSVIGNVITFTKIN